MSNRVPSLMPRLLYQMLRLMLVFYVYVAHGVREPEHTVGFVMVDAGSSGSKLFSYGADHTTKLKLISDCMVWATGAGPALQTDGLAALSVLEEDEEACVNESTSLPTRQSRTSCHIGPDSAKSSQKTFQLLGMKVEEQYNSLANVYADFVLEALWRMHRVKCGGKDECKARNADHVSILATAGMRLLTKTQNDDVWEKICGKEANVSSGGYSFAPLGPGCGTIPGTEEAFYEFFANLDNGHSDKPMGIFTIGGASAQIAVPLFGEDEARFDAAIATVKARVGDCTGIRFLTGKQAQKQIPIFTLSAGKTPNDCYKDFIDRRDVSDYHASFPKLAGVTSIGVVSFLGLGGLSGGLGVAGGANQIQAWALEHDCSKDFTVCKKVLDDNLEHDVLFQATKTFFSTSSVKARSKFSYNTPAAQPLSQFDKKNDVFKKEPTSDKKQWVWNHFKSIIEAVGEIVTQFVSKVTNVVRRSKKGNQVWEKPTDVLKDVVMSNDSKEREVAGEALGATLEVWCEGLHGIDGGFGFNKANTCIKAQWTSLYISSFFQHDDGADVFFDTERDWTQGVHLIMKAGPE